MNNIKRLGTNPPPVPPFDRLVTFCLQNGWEKLAHGLLWHFKGDKTSSYIRWNSPEGLAWVLNPHLFLDAILLQERTHDTEVFDALVPHLRPTDVLWDVGANLGWMSLRLKAVCPEMHVVCFEPTPALSQQLSRNAALNNMAVQLVSAPLADRWRVEAFHVKTSRNSGQNSLRPWRDVQYDQTLTVLCDAGQNLVDSGTIPAPTVAKIDVEQFEWEVISGMDRLLARPEMRVLTFECLTFHSPESAARFELIKTKLASHGFKLEEITPKPGMPVENYLATRLS